MSRVAKELGLTMSALSTTVEQHEVIMKNFLSLNVNAKEAETAQRVEHEGTMLTWFKEVTAAGVNIGCIVLCKKADEITFPCRLTNFRLHMGGCTILKRYITLCTKASVGKQKKLMR